MSFYRGLESEHVVACAHEYTESNLVFAAQTMPNHKAITERLARLSEEKGRAKSSVPDLLGKEFQTNPFVSVKQCASTGFGATFFGARRNRSLRLFAAGERSVLSTKIIGPPLQIRAQLVVSALRLFCNPKSPT